MKKALLTLTAILALAGSAEAKPIPPPEKPSPYVTLNSLYRECDLQFKDEEGKRALCIAEKDGIKEYLKSYYKLNKEYELVFRRIYMDLAFPAKNDASELKTPSAFAMLGIVPAPKKRSEKERETAIKSCRIIRNGSIAMLESLIGESFVNYEKMIEENPEFATLVDYHALFAQRVFTFYMYGTLISQHKCEK